MENIKIDSNILVVKLRDSDELKICRGRVDSLVMADDIFAERTYFLNDAENYCSITYISSLKKIFNKYLDKESIKELQSLLQEKKYKNQFTKACVSLKKSVKNTGNLIGKEDCHVYSQLNKE